MNEGRSKSQLRAAPDSVDTGQDDPDPVSSSSRKNESGRLNRKRSRRDRERSAGTILLTVTGAWLALLALAAVASVLLSDDALVQAQRAAEIRLVDYGIEPTVIEVPTRTQLVLTVTNLGEVQHDLQIAPEVGTGRIKPGDDATLTVGPFDRSLVIWCSIKGHRQLGMEARINIVEL